MIKSCNSCGKKEDLNLWKISKNKKRRRDGKIYYAKIAYFKPVGGGRIWARSICGDCLLERKRKSSGFNHRDLSTYQPIVDFVRSEKEAQAHFERLGFTVKRTSGPGPDLRCSIGSLEWTVEVKRACWDSGSWRSRKVRPRRRNDDLIALVLPNGRVYIDSMPIHLAACGKNGNRTITGIVKEFGLN